MIPCLYYARYLVSLGKEDRDIVADLTLLGFDVTRNHVESIRASLMLPPVFRNHAAGESVNEKFLVKYAARFNMKELWTYKLNGKPPEVREMMQLVRDHDLRLIPLILTLKKDPAPERALEEMGKNYSPKAVQLMLHYFFNTKILNLSAWREILKVMSPPAADLIDQPLDYIRYRLGLKPSLTFPQILSDFMHQSYFQSKEFMQIASRDNVDMAKKMAELSIKAGVLLQKYGAGDTRTFLDDVRLGFERANLEIPAIEEIEEDTELEEPFELI